MARRLQVLSALSDQIDALLCVFEKSASSHIVPTHLHRISYQLDVWPAVSHLGLILCAPSGPFRPGLGLLPSLKAVPWQISSNTCFRTTQYCYQANAGAKYVICAYASACVRSYSHTRGAGLNWLAGRRRRFMQEGPGFEDEQASCSASADLTWTTIK